MKYQILITICLIFVLGHLQANNGDRIPPVERDFLSHYVPRAKSVDIKGEPSTNKKKVSFKAKEDKIGQSGFHFPEIDKELEDMAQKADNFTDPSLDDMKDVLKVVDSEDVKKARAVLNHAMEVGNFVSKLTGDDLVSLPIVMEKKMGNITARIVFHSMELLPDRASLDVYAGVKIPQKNGGKDVELMFGVSGLEFSYEGGIVGNADLGLLSDFSFELGGAKKKAVVVLNKWNQVAPPPGSSSTELINKGTFITLGCDGIEEFGIEADIIFTRQWVLPTDDFGNVIQAPTSSTPNANSTPTNNSSNDGNSNSDNNSSANEGGSTASPPRVKAHFAVTVQDWNNMLFENITISHFVLTKFQDISFYVGNANVDLSDFRNPQTLVFPEDYLSELPPGQPELWRGVYIETVEITLPKPFKKNCDSYGTPPPGLEDTGDINGLPATDNSLEGWASAPLSRPKTEHFRDFESAQKESRGGPTDELIFDDEDIEVPESIKQEYEPYQVSTEGCRIKVGAKDLIIDRFGVTGQFYIEGEAPIIGGGQMDGAWGFSLDYLQIGLYKSKVTAFGFGGQIAIPIAQQDTPLDYTGLLNFNNPDNPNDDIYEFSVEFGDDMKFPVFKAGEVIIKEGTGLNITVVDEEDGDQEFTAKITLYAEMYIGAMNDDAKAKIPLVDVEGMILSTRAPYIDFVPNGGIFISTQGGNGKLMNFPVSVSQFAFQKQGETHLSLTATIGLNLTQSSDAGFSGSGTFSLMGKLEPDGNGVHRWVFDKFQFHGATVEMDIGVFKAKGTIYIFDEHPTYGDGFYGTLDAGILGEGDNAKIRIQLAAMFGKMPGYRYFMMDGFASGTAINVPLFPPAIYLNGFGGGVFYHMKPAGYVDPEGGAVAAAGIPTPTSENPDIPDTSDLPEGVGSDLTGLVYEPTTDTKFGLKFTVGFNANANAIVGKLSCIIRFGPGMNLQNISFWGVADFMEGIEGVTKKLANFQDRIKDLPLTDNEIKTKDKQEAEAAAQQETEDIMRAKVGIGLDFDGGFSFHGYAELVIAMPDVGLIGSGAVDLLIDPKNDKWHLFIGGYTDGSVTVPSFFGDSEVVLYPVHASISYKESFEVSADLYFLLGTDIPGPPPLHPQAAEFFGNEGETASQNRDGLYCGDRSPASATGIAFGAAAFFKVDFDKGAKFCLFRIRVKASGGVGFDVALLKYDKNSVCATGAQPKNPDKPQGIKGFRMTGRIWAFINIDGGKIICIPLPKLGIGLKIEADLINPSYFDARVYVRFFGKKVDFGLKIGKQCGAACSPDNWDN